MVDQMNSFRLCCRYLFIFIACLFSSAPVCFGDESAASDADSKPSEAAETPEGHSLHGEVFNEGPRQAAYLMDGVGTVRFEVTTVSDAARAFVRQGVAQLHGFWYFESERSFRQAAMLDPDCAIAYWGMAMSNRKNESRAKGFIKEAMDRKDKASRTEQLFIQAFDKYINAKAGSSAEKEKRSKAYVSALEDLLFEFPDNIEAKAFLCEFLWSARRQGIDMVSYLAVDAMIQDVLDVEPLHPIHHYRIHLWDTKKPEKALESAARCGLAAPAIAHMWHMPGHIYSRLKRYHDAVYQQEASARVDHAHMMKDLVLPDQIHNFAHNNEWCIRNLIHIGRVNDAVALAKNMIQLPRHPKYNHIGKFGSYKYGRQRLLGVLRTYQLHDRIVALSETPYLETSDDETEDLTRDRYLGAALVAVGDVDKANAIRTRLEADLEERRTKQKQAGDEAEKKATDEKKDEKQIKKARSDAEGKFRSRIRDLEKAIQEIDGRLALRNGDLDQAIKLLDEAGGVPVEEQVAVLLQAGRTDDAIKKINDHVRSNNNEVRPLAAQVETLWAADRKDEARKAMEELRKISATIDPEIPAFARLNPIAAELGFTDDWRVPQTTADDIGARPPLDALGPFRWQPVAAPDWSLPGVDGQPRSLAQYRGKPVVAIFYLGAGCLHCAEQLQKFAPKTEEFRKAGFEVVAISTDKQEILHLAYEDLEEEFPFPLVSDAELNTFKAYRCYDDFEAQPLHGTFVIDANGMIRWQDISYEPFMDPDFVLKEAVRLLAQDQPESKSGESELTVNR
ncbi:MAG: redoxin domain-containing protein [Fuerstiella sp.]